MAPECHTPPFQSKVMSLKHLESNAKASPKPSTPSRKTCRQARSNLDACVAQKAHVPIQRVLGSGCTHTLQYLARTTLSHRYPILLVDGAPESPYCSVKDSTQNLVKRGVSSSSYVP